VTDKYFFVFFLIFFTHFLQRKAPSAYIVCTFTCDHHKTDMIIAIIYVKI